MCITRSSHIAGNINDGNRYACISEFSCRLISFIRRPILDEHLAELDRKRLQGDGPQEGEKSFIQKYVRFDLCVPVHIYLFIQMKMQYILLAIIFMFISFIPHGLGPEFDLCAKSENFVQLSLCITSFFSLTQWMYMVPLFIMMILNNGAPDTAAEGAVARAPAPTR